MRDYESIDARPFTPRRIGFVALALVAGVAALNRTTNLSPAGTHGALFGASIVHPNVTSIGSMHNGTAHSNVTSTVSTHDGRIHPNVTSINSTHNATMHPNVTSSKPDCMPHCGDSSEYSYSYVDGGSAHSHADDDADDPCHHVVDDNDIIDYTPIPTKEPTAPTTAAPTAGRTTSPTPAPTVVASHNQSAAVSRGKCEDDDDVVAIATNNSKLHIVRTHTTTHHHHVDLDRNGSKTWDDDNHLLIDDDTSHDSRVGNISTYCGLKIAKNTQSSANATASFQFYVDYLGAYCESNEKCKVGCERCGHAVRAALPGVTPHGDRADYSCFGLHSVDATGRPQGPIPFADAVATFERGLRGLSRITPFIDQSTMLYAQRADKYVELLERGGETYLLGEWYSELGMRLYSVIAHVPGTVGCVEIVTRMIDERYLRNVTKMNHVRLPDSAFEVAGIDIAASGTSDLLLPLAVSKVTSSMYEVTKFYENVLLAREVAYSKSENSAWGKVYLLHEGDMVVRFVQSHAGGVKNLENLKKDTHNASYASPWCGTDRYYDNHYAYSRSTAPANLSLVAIASRARAAHTRWHCEDSAIYLWEPTGDMVYVTDATTTADDAGSWAIDKLHDPAVSEDLAFCEEYGYSQSAMCTQGYCTDSGVVVAITDDDC